MAANKASQGMFADLGLDMRTQEQILAQRAVDNTKRANTAPEGTERFAGDHSLQRGGQVIGNLINTKFGKKPKLEPQEQIQVDAMSAAQDLFKAKKANGEYLGPKGKPDLTKEAAGFQSAVAGELLKINDPRGMELAKQIDSEFRARRADDEARIKGGLAIEGAEGDNKDAIRERENAIYDRDRDQMLTHQGELTPIYPRGSDDPNSGIMAYIQEVGGDAKTAAGAEFPLGSYSTMRPKAPTAGSKPGDLPRLKDFMTMNNVGKLQARQRGLIGQLDMAVAMTDAISGSIGDDGSINMMSTGGKMSAGAVRLAENIQSLGRQIGSVLQIENADGTIASMTGSENSIDSYVDNNQDLFTEDMIPDSIRGDTIATAKYQAIIVRFAYGTARLNEGGTRITDEDFKNAVKQIGGAATDPEALRQILVGGLEAQTKDFEVWKEQLIPGLYEQIIAPKADAMYEEARANFTTRFADPFGTAANPSDAIVNPAGERRDGLTEPANAAQVEISAKQQKLNDLRKQRSEREGK